MSRKSASRRNKPHRAGHPPTTANAAHQHAVKPSPRSTRDKVVLALSLFGLLLTGYLSYVAFTRSGTAFCAEGSGCDVVQGSQWSRFLGLPVAAWGFALYALLAWVAWRPAPRGVRWRRAWRLAFLGLAISLYLTLVGAIALQAFCAWCLLSLATLAAIFAVLQSSRPDGAPGTPWPTWLLGNGLVALGLVAALHVSATGLLQRPEDPRLRGLAEHLQATGVKFYGASWCPNCTAQKKAFGASAERLPYVECSPNGRNGGVAFECTSAGIGGYPTWIIDGMPYTEVIEPERLAGMTGYDWEGAAAD